MLLSLLQKHGPLTDSPSPVPLQPLHSVHHPLAPMLQGPQGNVHGHLGGADGHCVLHLDQLVLQVGVCCTLCIWVGQVPHTPTHHAISLHNVGKRQSCCCLQASGQAQAVPTHGKGTEGCHILLAGKQPGG